jgi:tetratricopeptide (TPR) repeat protein
MKCPSCGKTVAESAWICGFCDHILDPSVLGDVYDADADTSEKVPVQSQREERTSLIAWNPKPEDAYEEVPDAMILGEPDESVSDSQIMRGAAQKSDGRTATYLFYATGATSRIVHPDSVPRITGGDPTIPRTPYEDFILSQIDGVRSVRDIHRTSGLAPQEVVVTLLTLLDKGAIRIDGLSGLDASTEKTQSIERPQSADRKRRKKDLDDLINMADSVSRMLPPARSDSFSDVWAESNPDSSVNADLLIEDEEEDPTHEENELEEEVTNTVRAPSMPVRNERSDTKPPSKVAAPPKTPIPLELDPAYLVEVPEWGGDYDSDPVVAPIEARRASSGKKKRAQENQRRVLEKAVKRGPIQEKQRPDSEEQRPGSTAPVAPVSSGAKKLPDAPAQSEAPTNKPQGVRAGERDGGGGAHPDKRAGKAEPVDSLNMLKAQKLFDQALKDKAEGNLVSARMNMKLAMTFDATNELYAQAFDELSKNPDAQVKGNGITGKSRARELYDQATEAENAGDADRAIALLEQAIGVSKQAPFMNRLGVILAMKKREFARAQQLVEQAIELAPDNAAYEKNLQKILSMAATSDLKKGEDKGDKKGLLGLLGRRK